MPIIKTLMTVDEETIYKMSISPSTFRVDARPARGAAKSHASGAVAKKVHHGGHDKTTEQGERLHHGQGSCETCHGYF